MGIYFRRIVSVMPAGWHGDHPRDLLNTRGSVACDMVGGTRPKPLASRRRLRNPAAIVHQLLRRTSWSAGPQKRPISADRHANRRNKMLLHAVSHSVMGCAHPGLQKSKFGTCCAGRCCARGAATAGRFTPNSTDCAALHSLVREGTRRPKRLIESWGRRDARAGFER